jgi:hypothetical protein
LPAGSRPAGFSFVALQLPLAPMMILAVGIERPDFMAVQRLYDADRVSIVGVKKKLPVSRRPLSVE